MVVSLPWVLGGNGGCRRVVATLRTTVSVRVSGSLFGAAMMPCAGAFFSPRMMQLLLFQCYYNRYLISIVGGLLRCGTGSDIRDVHEVHDGHLPAQVAEDLSNTDPNQHVEFTGRARGRLGSTNSSSGGGGKEQAAPAAAADNAAAHGVAAGTQTAEEGAAAAEPSTGAGHGAGAGSVTSPHARPASSLAPTPDTTTSLRAPASGGTRSRRGRSNSWGESGGHRGYTADGARLHVHSDRAPVGAVGCSDGAVIGSPSGAQSILELPNTPVGMLPWHRRATGQGHTGSPASRDGRSGSGDAKGRRGPSFTQSFLRQLPVPDIMAGQTYGALFRHLVLTQDALPLSLLRAAYGATRAPHAYVYTNPPATTRISAGDKVFCLVHDS